MKHQNIKFELFYGNHPCLGQIKIKLNKGFLDTKKLLSSEVVVTGLAKCNKH
jgi:hypothetical protein